MVQQLSHTINPRRLFLMDGLGALLSALMLGIVLPAIERTFGMPRQVLYVLASLALIFSVYSLLCYFMNLKKPRPFLKWIAIVNLLYCCLTIGLITYWYQQLTVLGFLYFGLEIGIVALLSFAELSTAANPAGAGL